MNVGRFAAEFVMMFLAYRLCCDKVRMCIKQPLLYILDLSCKNQGLFFAKFRIKNEEH